MITIREEQPGDVQGVREVYIHAFDQPLEADLVDQLRQRSDDLLALVAEMEDRIVGHILFSPAVIERRKQTVQGMVLAPMAVLPEYQRQGIGSQLVQAGIEALKQVECPFIILVGHPGYYPRFGFEPASHYGIRSEWAVPDDSFMVLVLDEQKRNALSGVAKYRPEFTEVG
ncbi:MAG: N-acetyltransferase [Deltaproteobacteria bacterium]|nr:N-acetyltransferase [Deltaproteobacteria bacterium]